MRSAAPTIPAHCRTTASWSWRSTSWSAPPTSPTTAADGTATPSNRTVANRRTRSRLWRGETVIPAASAGTRNWVSPSSTRAATSR